MSWSICGVSSAAGCLRGVDGRDKEAVFVVDFRGTGALYAFDEDLDVAVRHLRTDCTMLPIDTDVV